MIYKNYFSLIINFNYQFIDSHVPGHFPVLPILHLSGHRRPRRCGTPMDGGGAEEGGW
jgi:hypothetical protein